VNHSLMRVRPVTQKSRAQSLISSSSAHQNRPDPVALFWGGMSNSALSLITSLTKAPSGPAKARACASEWNMGTGSGGPASLLATRPKNADAAVPGALWPEFCGEIRGSPPGLAPSAVAEAPRHPEVPRPSAAGRSGRGTPGRTRSGRPA